MHRHLVKMAAAVELKQAMRQKVKAALKKLDQEARHRESMPHAFLSFYAQLWHQTEGTLDPHAWEMSRCRNQFAVASTRLRQSVQILLTPGALISAKLLASERLKSYRNFGVYVHAERLREVDTTEILQHILQASEPSICYVPLVMDNNANMKLLHIESLGDFCAVPPFGIREPSEKYTDGSLRKDAAITRFTLNKFTKVIPILRSFRRLVLTAAEILDVLIMPGLAFDRSGGRLGRGGGYYDHFIAQCRQRASQLGRPTPLLVALAFQDQMVDNVPMTEHDEKIDVLVTSDEVYRLTERAAQF